MSIQTVFLFMAFPALLSSAMVMPQNRAAENQKFLAERQRTQYQACYSGASKLRQAKVLHPEGML
jgi:hypothetical protein